MTTLESVEQSVRAAIAASLGIRELRLGRLSSPPRPPCDAAEITSFWVAFVPTSSSHTTQLFARINFDNGRSTIIYGTADSINRLDQEAKIEYDLDSIVMRPDFSCNDWKPTALRSDDPQHCRAIVTTWRWHAQLDLFGPDAFKDAGVSQAIDQFKRQFVDRL